MSRLIEDVYNKIIIKIPDSEIEMKAELKIFINSLWNKAPEVRTGPEVFIPFVNILSRYIDSNDLNLTGWKKEVVNIFNDKKEYMEDFEYNEDMKDFDYMHHTMMHYN